MKYSKKELKRLKTLALKMNPTSLPWWMWLRANGYDLNDPTPHLWMSFYMPED